VILDLIIHRWRTALKYGSQSEVGRVESILLKHPRDTFIDQENVDRQWKALNYTSPPICRKAIEEYDRFIELLCQDIPEIHYLPSDLNTSLDSIYVHDPVVITTAGAILCNMGKAQRTGEPKVFGEHLGQLGIPILGSIGGDGRLEGGDIVWFDERTLAVGEGYRTNAEGIRQLKELTSGLVDEFIVVSLPHWNGPGDVLHLMSMISPIDRDIAAVYSRLMPVRFREWLLDREMELIEIPDSEYDSMACNILATAPRRCVMLAGNSITKRLLEEAGAVVREYVGDEISKKGAGGPTCLTRPLRRSS